MRDQGIHAVSRLLGKAAVSKFHLLRVSRSCLTAGDIIAAYTLVTRSVSGGLERFYGSDVPSYMKHQVAAIVGQYDPYRPLHLFDRKRR